MLKLLTAAAFVALVSTPVEAKRTEQQERMVQCNKGWNAYKKANDLKGYDRKKYLSDCLAGRVEPGVKVKPVQTEELQPQRRRMP